MSGNDLDYSQLVVSDEDVMDMLGIEAIEGTDPVQYQAVNVWYDSEGNRQSEPSHINRTDMSMGTVTMTPQDRINTMVHLLGNDHPAVQQLVYNDPTLVHHYNTDIQNQPSEDFALSPEQDQTLRTLLFFGDQHRMRELFPDSQFAGLNENSAFLNENAYANILNVQNEEEEGIEYNFSAISSIESAEDALLLFDSLSDYSRNNTNTGSFILPENATTMMEEYIIVAKASSDRTALLSGSADYTSAASDNNAETNGFQTVTVHRTRQEIITEMAETPQYNDLILGGIDGSTPPNGDGIESMEMARTLSTIAREDPTLFTDFLAIAEVQSYLQDENQFSVEQLNAADNEMSVEQRAELLSTLYFHNGPQRSGYDDAAAELSALITENTADSLFDTLNTGESTSYPTAEWIDSGDQPQTPLNTNTINDRTEALEMLYENPDLADEVTARFTDDTFATFFESLPPEQWQEVNDFFPSFELSDELRITVLDTATMDYIHIHPTDYSIADYPIERFTIQVMDESGLYFTDAPDGITFSEAGSITEERRNELESNHDRANEINAALEILNDPPTTLADNGTTIIYDNDAIESAINDLNEIAQDAQGQALLANIITQNVANQTATALASTSHPDTFNTFIETHTDHDVSNEILFNNLFDIDFNEPNLVFPYIADVVGSQESFDQLYGSLPPEQWVAAAQLENYNNFNIDSTVIVQRTDADGAISYVPIEPQEIDLNTDTIVTLQADGSYAPLEGDITLESAALDITLTQPLLDILSDINATQAEQQAALDGLQVLSELEGFSDQISPETIDAIARNGNIEFDELNTLSDILNGERNIQNLSTLQARLADSAAELMGNAGSSILNGEVSTEEMSNPITIIAVDERGNITGTEDIYITASEEIANADPEDNYYLREEAIALANDRIDSVNSQYNADIVSIESIITDSLTGQQNQENILNNVNSPDVAAVRNDEGEIEVVSAYDADGDGITTSDEVQEEPDSTISEQANETTITELVDEGTIIEDRLDFDVIPTFLPEVATDGRGFTVVESIIGDTVMDDNGNTTNHTFNSVTLLSDQGFTVHVEHATNMGYGDPDLGNGNNVVVEIVGANGQGNQYVLNTNGEEIDYQALAESIATNGNLPGIENGNFVATEVHAQDVDSGEFLYDENGNPEMYDTTGHAFSDALPDIVSNVSLGAAEWLDVTHNTPLHTVSELENGIIAYQGAALITEETNKRELTENVVFQHPGSEYITINNADNNVVLFNPHEQTTIDITHTSDGQIQINMIPTAGQGEQILVDLAEGTTIDQAALEAMASDLVSGQNIDAVISNLDGATITTRLDINREIGDEPTIGRETVFIDPVFMDASSSVLIHEGQSYMVMDDQDMTAIAAFDTAAFGMMENEFGNEAFLNVISNESFMANILAADNMDEFAPFIFQQREHILDQHVMDKGDLENFLTSLPSDMRLEVINHPAFMAELAEHPRYMDVIDIQSDFISPDASLEEQMAAVVQYSAMLDNLEAAGVDVSNHRENLQEFLEGIQSDFISPDASIEEQMAAVVQYSTMLDNLEAAGVDVSNNRENLQEFIEEIGLDEVTLRDAETQDYDMEASIDATDGLDSAELHGIIEELAGMCIEPERVMPAAGQESLMNADLIAEIGDVIGALESSDVDSIQNSYNSSGQERQDGAALATQN